MTEFDPQSIVNLWDSDRSGRYADDEDEGNVMYAFRFLVSISGSNSVRLDGILAQVREIQVLGSGLGW